ncbi:hypothetical protein TNCV_3043111 [Trichonephila clavipes]|nr:hypothetical protein TNCV_3043111 [Trichonephila clavipes]
MTSHNHLNDSFSWRFVGRLEFGQSQAKRVRRLQGEPKVISRCEINSKQVVLSPERSIKVPLSNDVCIGLLIGIKRMATTADNERKDKLFL